MRNFHGAVIRLVPCEVCNKITPRKYAGRSIISSNNREIYQRRSASALSSSCLISISETASSSRNNSRKYSVFMLYFVRSATSKICPSSISIYQCIMSSQLIIAARINRINYKWWLNLRMAVAGGQSARRSRRLMRARAILWRQRLRRWLISKPV